MKKYMLSESKINYDVYNALNLYNEDLGQLYLSEQFNPFSASFELNEDFVVGRLVNSHTNKEIVEPEFVSEGAKKTEVAFKNSANNCTMLLAEIENKLQDHNLAESLKEELKQLKIYLLCRLALLNNYTKSIKKNKNTLKMYKNIQSLDWKNAELLEESYKEQFDIQIAINAYLEFAKAQSKEYKKELENKKLIAKAKEIIKNNERLEENTRANEPQSTVAQPAQTTQSKAKYSNQKSKEQTQTYKQSEDERSM